VEGDRDEERFITGAEEVLTMSTRTVQQDPGSLDRQQTQRRRRGAGKRLGAFAVMVAIGLVAASCTPGTRDGERGTAPADQPATVYPADPKAKEVATGFVKAYGAFHPDRAMSYLTEDAIAAEWGTPEEFRLLISLLEAIGFKQTINHCEQQSDSASGVRVRCAFDVHSLRSDEIGLGPYTDNYWDLTVRDGKIVSATESSAYLTNGFSEEMWEPFRDWVLATHPRDFDVMYCCGGDNFRLTEESIRLWGRHTREYVKEVGP
jgi:hypothetical protein